MNFRILSVFFIVVCTQNVFSQNYDSLIIFHQKYNNSFNLTQVLQEMDEMNDQLPKLTESLKTKNKEDNNIFRSQISYEINDKILSYQKRAHRDLEMVESTVKNIIKGDYVSTNQSAIQFFEQLPTYITIGFNNTLQALYSSNQFLKISLEAARITNITDFERVQYYQVTWEAKAQLERVRNQLDLWVDLDTQNGIIQEALFNMTRLRQISASALWQSGVSLISLKSAMKELTGRSREANNHAVQLVFKALDDTNTALSASLEICYTYNLVKGNIQKFKVVFGTAIQIPANIFKSQEDLKQISAQKEEILDLFNLIQQDSITVGNAERDIIEQLLNQSVQQILTPSLVQQNESKSDDTPIKQSIEDLIEDINILENQIINELVDVGQLKSYQHFLERNNTQECIERITQNDQKNSFLESFIQNEIQKHVSQFQECIHLGNTYRDAERWKLKQEIEKYQEELRKCERTKTNYQQYTSKLENQLSNIFKKILPKEELPITLFSELFESSKQSERDQHRIIIYEQFPSSMKQNSTLISDDKKQQLNAMKMLIEKISYCSTDDANVQYEQTKQIVQNSLNYQENKAVIMHELDTAASLVEDILEQIECQGDDKFPKQRESIVYCDSNRKQISSQQIIESKSLVENASVLVQIINQNKTLEQQLMYPMNEDEIYSLAFDKFLNSLLMELYETSSLLSQTNQGICLFEIFSDQLLREYRSSFKK